MYAIFFFVVFCSVVWSQTTVEVTTVDFGVTGVGTTPENETTVLLPKCCPPGFAVGSGNCSESTVDFQPKFNFYRHNETAFDDEPIDPNLITINTYVNDSCQGQKFPLSPDEGPMFLVNGSLLLAGMGEYDGVLGQYQFCIDNLNIIPDDSTVYVFVCVKDLEENLPRWVFSTYITLVTISAILFTSSGVFFYQQDVQGAHKKSYVAYAISMSVTYLVIVLVQFVSWGCKFFGLLLQFFVTLSFAWLAVLCFDLAWSIHFYRKKEKLNRFNFYIGTTVIFSSIFLLISLCNNAVPDIPYSFFKPQFDRTSCMEFENQHTSLFFVAILLTLVVSVMSLCYSLMKMNQNRYRNTTDGVLQWRKVSKKFSYMYGRKLVLFVTMIIWIFDAFSDRFPQNSSLSIIVLCVQAFHGFIVVPLYTMKTLRRVINVNNKPRIDNLDELLEAENNQGNPRSTRMV